MNVDCKSEYPELEKMASQELEALLRTELEKDQPNREMVLWILGILETRQTETQVTDDAPSYGRHRRRSTAHWFKKAFAAAAIVLAFVFAAPPVFGAENIVELVGRWTHSIFALFRSDVIDQLQTEYVYKTNNQGLQKIYDAAVENGITQQVVPTWAPEGCELADIRSKSTPEGINIQAYMADNEFYVHIALATYTDSTATKYSKDDEDAVVYEIANVKHYLVANEDTWAAVWAVDGTECFISTTYDKDTLCKILQSIYVEEE